MLSRHRNSVLEQIGRQAVSGAMSSGSGNWRAAGWRQQALSVAGRGRFLTDNSGQPRCVRRRSNDGGAQRLQTEKLTDRTVVTMRIRRCLLIVLCILLRRMGAAVVGVVISDRS